MRISATIAAVFLCLAISVPAFPQDAGPDHPRDENARDKDAKGHDARQDDQNKRQDENRRDDSRPDARQQDNRDRNDTRPQEQTRPEDRRNDNTSRPEDRRQQDQVRQEQGRQDQGRGAAQEQTRINNQGRTGGEHRGTRIPDNRFRASFGREHHFHVERARIVNQAQPEFVYGGYTFELSEPWPAEWSFDDDCYIDYTDDDYYLYDAYHPGIRILVFVIGG